LLSLLLLLLLLLVVVMVVVRLEQVMKIYCISFTWVLIRNRRRPRDYLQNPSEIEPYYKIKSLTTTKLPLQNQFTNLNIHPITQSTTDSSAPISNILPTSKEINFKEVSG